MKGNHITFDLPRNQERKTSPTGHCTLVHLLVYTKHFPGVKPIHQLTSLVEIFFKMFVISVPRVLYSASSSLQQRTFQWRSVVMEWARDTARQMPWALKSARNYAQTDRSQALFAGKEVSKSI